MSVRIELGHAIALGIRDVVTENGGATLARTGGLELID